MSQLHHTHQYVGKKIRRIRWQKITTRALATTIPDKFATASWDETAPNSKNEVAIWHLASEEVDEGKTMGPAGMMDDDCYSLTHVPELDWKFVRSAGIQVDSDVPELQFLDEDHLLFTTGGDIVAAKWIRNERQIQSLHTSRIHGEGEISVGFSLSGTDIISVGSDGALVRLDVSAMARQEHTGKADQNVNKIENTGNGPLLCIEHFGANEIVTGNLTGQLQLWDLRRRIPGVRQLAVTIPDSGAVTAIRSHPSQRHILVAGYQSGALAFWDLRNDTQSLMSSATNVHSGPVWELYFHPISPSHLFSACNDGLLLHWDASGIRLIGENVGISPWSLTVEELRDQVKLTNLLPANTLPVNTLDVVGDSLLAGVDDESIWMVRNLPIS